MEDVGPGVVLPVFCEDEAGFCDICVAFVSEDAEVDVADVDGIDIEVSDVDEANVDEAGVDDIDLEFEDIPDINEEVREDRLLGTELCFNDAEVGREELLPDGEPDSVADGEVFWEEILVDSGLSFAVDASLNMGVSLDARSWLDAGVSFKAGVPLDIGISVEAGISFDVAVAFALFDAVA